MGYIKHHAIVVTAGDKGNANTGKQKAEALGLECTTIVGSRINGYYSFLIIPDGSKEGWVDSDKGNEARSAWIAWVKESYIKGVWLDWALVRFGGDDSDCAELEDHGGKDKGQS